MTVTEACHIAGEGYYRTEKCWSNTTSRHIGKWLSIMGARDPAALKPQEFFDSMVQS